MDEQGPRDLYVLVADLDMLQTMKGLLSRAQSLGVRPIRYTVGRHLRRDPGCRIEASQYLRGYISDYEHALVVLDRIGCGASAPREEIQHAVERDLSANGWRDRSKAIVIDPELETWIWNGSNSVPKVLGWAGGYENPRAWLATQDPWPSSSAKPPDPKEAMRVALRKVRRSVSARLFGQLAESTTLRRCQDPAFNELKDTLQHWFPAVYR